ncbi:AbfB domain-containing protein [Streptomyces sp. NPDC050535]|uniref:AbfB domain-containing protein n=1 Tax=Streptomyces sp. NPDC050535 TaxID=3365626 RepID=UPI003793830F
MPPTNPEPGPEQPAGSAESPVPSTEIAAWRPTTHGAPYPAEMPPFAELPIPWGSYETVTETRLPGTRRLWLAAGLAVAVLIATATAIAVLDKGTDAQSQDRANRPASDTGVPFIPGVSDPATGGVVAPTGRAASSASPSLSPSPTASQGAASANASGQGSDGKPVPAPSKPTASSKPSASATAAARTSVQSVNYPDRYWRVSGGSVRLDQVSRQSPASTRRDASFKKVKGLADSSCYSFATTDGGYLRHRDFVLRAERDDGSALFEKDATFCARTVSDSGTVVLESVNYPGRYLRHRNFELRLERYDNNNRRGHEDGDWAFRLVKGLS